MGVARTHRVLGLGVGLSLALHALMVVTGVVAGKPSGPSTAGEDTDIELAPEAPEAHLPQPGPESQPLPPPEAEPQQPPEPDPQVATTEQPGTVDEPDLDTTVADAGVPDAGALAAADAGAGDAGTAVAMGDAGAADAGTAVAMGDAGAGGDGGMVASTGGDAGPIATNEPPGPGGDGTGVTPSNEPDPYDGKPPPGAAANLLAYFPVGEKVTVLIRLDRFRGTQWSKRLDKILEPMPDYAGLVGKRKMALTDEFESISISSASPKDAKATTVMVRHKRTPAQMRTFLGKGGAPVVWQSTRAGALGVRGKSKMLVEGDKRVFLLPFPRYALLLRPELVGKFTAPSPAPLDAFPRDADLPEWMRRVQGFEEESGAKSGPAAVVTVGGLPLNFKVPMLGKIVAPQRLTVSMELVKNGVIIRGNMLFVDEKRAKSFVAQALKWQQFFNDSWQGKLALATAFANNAVKGLTLKQAGRQVGYATSISVADFRGMTDFAAKWTAGYFQQLEEAAAEKLRDDDLGSGAGGGAADSVPAPDDDPTPAPGGPSGPPK